MLHSGAVFCGERVGEWKFSIGVSLPERTVWLQHWSMKDQGILRKLQIGSTARVHATLKGGEKKGAKPCQKRPHAMLRSLNFSWGHDFPKAALWMGCVWYTLCYVPCARYFSNLTSLSSHNPKARYYYPYFIDELRLREAKELSLIHTADIWKKHDSPPTQLDQEFLFLEIPVSCEK